MRTFPLDKYKSPCDRADEWARTARPLWQLLREWDMHPSRFYWMYRKTRGVTWRTAHPRPAWGTK